jgi:hypothetical protein
LRPNDKQTHLAVDYRAGTSARHCSACTMYVAAPSAARDPEPHCTAVKDPIRPAGVCDIFKPKG